MNELLFKEPKAKAQDGEAEVLAAPGLLAVDNEPALVVARMEIEDNKARDRKVQLFYENRQKAEAALQTAREKAMNALIDALIKEVGKEEKIRREREE